MRNILFLTLSMFTFFGSIGIGVYSHLCSKDGLEQSYFIRQAHHCDEKEIILPSCCKHDDSNIELTNDCCSDQVQLVHIELDYFQQISSLKFVSLSTPNAIYELGDSIHKIKNVSKSNLANPPPKKSGRDIVIQNQVFLI
jgi:hypothetical protein